MSECCKRGGRCSRLRLQVTLVLGGQSGPQNGLYCSDFDRRILNDAVNKERLRPVHVPFTLECAEGAPKTRTQIRDIPYSERATSDSTATWMHTLQPYAVRLQTQTTKPAHAKNLKPEH